MSLKNLVNIMADNASQTQGAVLHLEQILFHLRGTKFKEMEEEEIKDTMKHPDDLIFNLNNEAAHQKLYNTKLGEALNELADIVGVSNPTGPVAKPSTLGSRLIERTQT